MKEKAAHYYGDLGKNCAEGILLAANEVYHLGLTDGEIQLFSGFGRGMGCGSTCGALSGAIGVLSRMYHHKSPDEFRTLCADFVSLFQKTLACNTIDCAPIAAKYKTDGARCVAAVVLAAQALEEYIDKLEGKGQKPQAEGCTLRPEDIKRVKGLGFLHHKGTNKFNGRIITRNGRITTGEAEAINRAAKLYGDGYMMFTTRLTVEVSGIDYKDIEAFQAEVGKAGLKTGGTGSKVRPVVACKGTTCQYGHTLSAKKSTNVFLRAIRMWPCPINLKSHWEDVPITA